MTHLYRIQIWAKAEALPWRRLIPILEMLLPVRFRFSMEWEAEQAGEIVLDDVVEMAKVRRLALLPSLQLPCQVKTVSRNEASVATVAFGKDPDVPFPFRGRTVCSKIINEPRTLLLEGKDKVLAQSQQGPVWAVSEEGGVRHYKSSFALPAIPESGTLQDVLTGDRWLEILPLLHWLREVCARTEYQGPALRACFMFDDPNLHWPSYGFLNFEQIARRAAKANYHVAFATIPLDTWLTHQPTAELFRKNTPSLSLLVHGNNHTKAELARNYSTQARVALLEQAIHRVERLERKTGLRVCRVMVPPHGACAEEMLALLARCGFEAACISHGSLRAHNPTKAWTRSLGYLPSEMIQGSPVLPRWGLNSTTMNSVLLAAFLNQPIVLRGHQGDLREGVELLDELAGFINSLGPVCWGNMTTLSRSNYQWRMEGQLCRLRPLGLKVTFQVPEGATQLLVEPVLGEQWRLWHVSSVDRSVLTVQDGTPVSLPEGCHGTLCVKAVLGPRPLGGSPANLALAAAFVRRLLTEGRDRFLFLQQRGGKAEVSSFGTALGNSSSAMATGDRSQGFS